MTIFVWFIILTKGNLPLSKNKKPEPVTAAITYLFKRLLTLKFAFSSLECLWYVRFTEDVTARGDKI